MSISTATAISTVQHPVAQRGSDRTATIVRHAAIGGIAGAAIGAGLSFTALPFIGALSAPIAAAIGGAAGLLVGGLVGFLRSRGGTQDAKSAASGVSQQVPPPPGSTSSGLPPALPR
jgi:hypothetical protein